MDSATDRLVEYVESKVGDFETKKYQKKDTENHSVSAVCRCRDVEQCCHESDNAHPCFHNRNDKPRRGSLPAHIHLALQRMNTYTWRGLP